MAEACDVLIIGAGMAGASVGARLAGSAKVIVLEREDYPGYHSTGRSAALFSETYGNAPVRALSRASRGFLFSPPSGFTGTALAHMRGSLYVARADQVPDVAAFIGEADVANETHKISTAEALKLCPILRADYVADAVLEPNAADVDVNALHQGFLRMLRGAGGRVVTDAGVTAIESRAGIWHVRSAAGDFAAPVVVDAAGAWADEIARLAGVPALGITPLRRTALLLEPPAGVAIEGIPNTIDIAEQFYFKPDAGLILLSPADETPSPPCDAQPDELDVAIAIDRIQAATTLDVRRVRRKWAGLRSFAPDRSPVIGYDPKVEGFFWLAGQGGYGIQTAPAASLLAAALIRHESVPSELARFGVTAESVSPMRFVR